MKVTNWIKKERKIRESKEGLTNWIKIKSKYVNKY